MAIELILTLGFTFSLGFVFVALVLLSQHKQERFQNIALLAKELSKELIDGETHVNLEIMKVLNVEQTLPLTNMYSHLTHSQDPLFLQPLKCVKFKEMKLRSNRS